MARRKSLAFLDVGQGDCFVADTKSGAIIFDGGSSSEDQVGRYRILPYMKYLGYQKIQIAVISHMDIDHYSGIKELLEMGKIKYLGLPEIPKDETMKKIIGIAKKRGTTIFYLSRGRQITTKDGSLKVLHPQKNSQMEKNAASLVMQGKILGYRVLAQQATPHGLTGYKKYDKDVSKETMSLFYLHADNPIHSPYLSKELHFLPHTM